MLLTTILESAAPAGCQWKVTRVPSGENDGEPSVPATDVSCIVVIAGSAALVTERRSVATLHIVATPAVTPSSARTAGRPVGGLRAGLTEARQRRKIATAVALELACRSRGGFRNPYGPLRERLSAALRRRFPVRAIPGGTTRRGGRSRGRRVSRAAPAFRGDSPRPIACVVVRRGAKSRARSMAAAAGRATLRAMAPGGAEHGDARRAPLVVEQRPGADSSGLHGAPLRVGIHGL